MNLFQHLQHAQVEHQTRRHFLRDGMAGMGAFWLAARAGQGASTTMDRDATRPLAMREPHFAARKARDLLAHGRRTKSARVV